jgi:hypothetical protein
MHKPVLSTYRLWRKENKKNENQLSTINSTTTYLTIFEIACKKRLDGT